MDRIELQSKINDLRLRNRSLHQQGMDILNRQTEGRFNVEDEAAFDKIELDRQSAEKLLRAYESELERMDSRSDIESAILEEREKASALSVDTTNTKTERDYINEYLLTGVYKDQRQADNELAWDYKRAIIKRNHGFNAVERRAQSVGTTTEGGSLVRDLYLDELIVALKAYNPVMEVARIIQTNTGGEFMIDTANDTANKAVLIAEETAASDTAWAVGQTSLKAYKYTSNIFKLSAELVEDSSYDAVAFTEDVISERFGRGFATAHTHGSGVNQPQGCVKALTSDSQNSAFPTDKADDVTDINITDFWDLEEKLDPAYRRNAVWMFAPAIETKLKKLSIGSADARPLWVPDLTSNSPGRVCGYSYVLNAEMTDFTTKDTDYAATDRIPRVILGDWSSFFVRLVNEQRTKRLGELFAATDQLGIVAFRRMDSKYVNAGTNPLVALRQIRGS